MPFFYTMHSLARRAYYSFRDNRLDKARIEISVLYPAFLFCGEVNVYLVEEVELYGFSYRMSVSGGAVISGILICILPAVVGADAIWFAMPVTELLVAIYVTIRMTQYTKAISVESGMR